MTESNTQEWKIEEASCGPFKGIIKHREEVLEDGNLFQYFIYGLTHEETDDRLLGIGVDVEEVRRQVVERVREYLSIEDEPTE